MRSAALALASVLGAIACSSPAARRPPPPSPSPAAPAPQPAPRPAPTVTLTVIGTNDLHGALELLPIYAGDIANLRAARAADGGGVILLDGGDMFQGTLESNTTEGVDVVRAYNQIGYAAAAVGNHEFDFGPVGPRVTPASPADDARGALKARAAEAKFPFLTSNIVDKKTGARIDWPNVLPSTEITVAGVKVGIIGASTESTPYTTMPANVADLTMAPTAETIAAEAQRLREGGAKVILVTSHIGSRCKKVDDAEDTSSCDKDEELFRLIAALPAGTVDVIVGGHTHAGVAHRISGVAAIESYASGRAFGRVDLSVAPDGRVTAARIHAPRAICQNDDSGGRAVAAAQCQPGDYEGKPVVADPAVQHIVDEAFARAAKRRAVKLGVKLLGPVTKSYESESAQGNWFGDLMLLARPDAQVALINGGGLRADLAAGELTYGQLFEAIPFDNRFATVELKGAHLRQLVATNLRRAGGILSFGGLTARARCEGDTLGVQVWVAGKPVVDGKAYRLVTSDFLASGGDGIIGRLELPVGAIKMSDGIIRETLADLLRKMKGARATIDPRKLYSAEKRRLDFEGSRPLKCGAAQ